MRVIFFWSAVLLSQSSGLSLVWAGGLQQAYEAALLKDSTFQAARAELLSARQNLPLAQAALLPNVSLSLSDAKVDGSRKTDNPPGQPITTTLDYRAPSQSVNLRAPIFNLEAKRKVTLARAQISYAEAVFAARKADLLDRLVNAWLQQFLAEQAIVPAQAQLDATQLQADLARRRLQLGEGTRLEVSEAESTLEMGTVLLSEAQDKWRVTRLTFQQISGLSVDFGPATSGGVESKVPPLSGLSIADESLVGLVDKADKGNPNIAARRDAVTLAQATVARNFAGHYPRLDVVASVSQNRNESLSTLNQSSRQRYLGLQLNLPLYSGGAVNASVAQALADQEKAEAELVAEQQSVARDLTRLYYSVSNSRGKITAQKKAIEFAQLAVDGTRKTMQAGFGVQAELATAQRKLAQSRYDLAQSVVDYLLASVRLTAVTGGDAGDPVSLLDSVLQSTVMQAQ